MSPPSQPPDHDEVLRTPDASVNVTDCAACHPGASGTVRDTVCSGELV